MHHHDLSPVDGKCRRVDRSGLSGGTLARFIAEGFYLSHVRRMRKIYAERREVFIEQFNKVLGDHFILEIADAGLHALEWFRSEMDLPIIQHAARPGKFGKACSGWRRH